MSLNLERNKCNNYKQLLGSILKILPTIFTDFNRLLWFLKDEPSYEIELHFSLYLEIVELIDE